MLTKDEEIKIIAEQVLEVDAEIREEEEARPTTIVLADDDGWEFALVEVMGFRKHYGRVREEERFGVKLMRVDVPIRGEPEANGWETHYYPGSALFSFSPTTEAVVLKANKPYEPARPALTRPSVDDYSPTISDDNDHDFDDGESP